MIQIVSELNGKQERRPGGSNWPDMEIVIDPAQTDIEDGEIYLVQVSNWSKPEVKKLIDNGSSVWLHPALATVHDASTIQIFGRKVPIQTVEFSDSIYKRHVQIHGKVVGLWAEKDGI